MDEDEIREITEDMTSFNVAGVTGRSLLCRFQQDADIHDGLKE